jgi:hypothetical protein
MEDEFTGRETERQDCVDSAIANLSVELIPDDCPFDWDIELIGEVRDALKTVIVDHMGAMTEQEFYPYRDLIPEEIKDAEENTPKEQWLIGEEDITYAVKKAIDDLDADDFAMFAGEILGGVCWFLNEKGLYSFVPDINYAGAFDFLNLGTQQGDEEDG